jgi:hypothetical protein
MASGIDKISNGLLFGAAFGVLAFYASSNIASISFFAGWMNSLATWIQAQTWATFLAGFTWLGYGLSAILGAIIGAYIDSR